MRKHLTLFQAYSSFWTDGSSEFRRPSNKGYTPHNVSVTPNQLTVTPNGRLWKEVGSETVLARARNNNNKTRKSFVYEEKT